jgi:hypothetical protein
VIALFLHSKGKKEEPAAALPMPGSPVAGGGGGGWNTAGPSEPKPPNSGEQNGPGAQRGGWNGPGQPKNYIRFPQPPAPPPASTPKNWLPIIHEPPVQ